MARRLLIVWDGKTLHDDDVDEIVWTDKGDGNITVQGKTKGASVGNSLIDILTAARAQRHEQDVADRRAAYDAETAVIESPPEVVEPEPEAATA